MVEQRAFPNVSINITPGFYLPVKPKKGREPASLEYIFGIDLPNHAHEYYHRDKVFPARIRRQRTSPIQSISATKRLQFAVALSIRTNRQLSTLYALQSRVSAWPILFCVDPCLLERQPNWQPVFCFNEARGSTRRFWHINILKYFCRVFAF